MRLYAHDGVSIIALEIALRSNMIEIREVSKLLNPCEDIQSGRDGAHKSNLEVLISLYTLYLLMDDL